MRFFYTAHQGHVLQPHYVWFRVTECGTKSDFWGPKNDNVRVYADQQTLVNLNVTWTFRGF